MTFSIGKIILAAIAMFVIAGLVYFGVWHLFSQFIWQHPMLSWLPVLAALVVGLLFGSLSGITSAGSKARAPSPGPSASGELAEPSTTVAEPTEQLGSSPDISSAINFRLGPGLLAGLAVLLLGLWLTLISPTRMSLDDIDYTVVSELPERTQPRLFPRSGIDDDPQFRDSKEVHLVRDPESGQLMWTGEWRGSWLSGESHGIAYKRLDTVVEPSAVVQGGFDHSVSAITPSTLKGKAKLDHPFSAIQYPVLIPGEEGEAFAMAPYMGFRGFPFRTPYLKGVLVYHQDGTLEDLTPEEAQARDELVRTGRIYPEKVARAEAEAIADSEEFEGEIVDGEGNKQPYLTAITDEKTVWVTIINEEGRGGKVTAVVLTDSSTGETEVWKPSADENLVSTERIIDLARALPLQWETTRCCDSDGHSYTVTLREVVEPRLAFKNGKPYYLVTVVPTDELAIGREVEYTLLIDAETGEELDRFDHVNGGRVEDARLEVFFR